MTRYTIWIVSLPNYPHSQCFNEVAIALNAAFRALGLESSIVTEPSQLGDVTIVLGCNLLPLVTVPAGKRLILFNLEQITPESPWLTREYLSLLRLYPVWDYSQQNIVELGRIGIYATHCGVGYMPELTCITPAYQDLDVLFIGSMNPRRIAVLADIANSGARLEARFNVYGEARDALIARSKIVLNLHFYEARVFEVVRVSYLLANRKCVVSETGADALLEEPFEAGVAFAPYDQLAERCMELLNDSDRRRTVAAHGFDRMTSFSQREYLRQALALSPMTA